MRADLPSLLRSGHPLLMPGVHDALGARLAEDAGFSAVSVGGAALAAVQLGLPDVGLQSFGEYVETLRRIAAATRLPLMVDGEHGFGDVKAVTRTMRVFEEIGLAGVAIEDLRFPPVLGARPSVVPLEEIGAKLSAALAARRHDTTWVIGRTDATLVHGLQQGLDRIRHFETIGVDAVLLTGLADLDAMRRVRDAVRCPVVAIVVEGGPWVAPTPAQVADVGFEMVVYPATLMLRAATALREGLAAIAQGDVGLPADSLGYAGMAQALRVSEWAAIDARVLPAV